MAQTARAARSGLLRLETAQSRRGLLDCVWWPLREVSIELPALITALTARLGPITPVGLDTSAWQDIPTRLVIDGKVVQGCRHPPGAPWRVMAMPFVDGLQANSAGLPRLPRGRPLSGPPARGKGRRLLTGETTGRWAPAVLRCC
ncbi:DUF5994 family protein [Streptomyces lavendulae]